MEEKREVVALCGGWNCCPRAEFCADGSMALIGDDGQRVDLTGEQAKALLLEITKRVVLRKA